MIHIKIKSKRGFASISKEKMKEIASLGGKTAWAKGTAHHWNSEEARKAGRLGGKWSVFVAKKKTKKKKK